MDVITAIKLYITKITDESGPGMKILLMDKETVIFVHENFLSVCIFNIWFHFFSFYFRQVLCPWHLVNRICFKRRFIFLKE